MGPVSGLGTDEHAWDLVLSRAVPLLTERPSPWSALGGPVVGRALRSAAPDLFLQEPHFCLRTDSGLPSFLKVKSIWYMQMRVPNIRRSRNLTATLSSPRPAPTQASATPTGAEGRKGQRGAHSVLLQGLARHGGRKLAGFHRAADTLSPGESEKLEARAGRQESG